VCTSRPMRIRTDGDYAYREDAIEDAAAFYDRNKTDSIVAACDDLPRLVAAVENLLEREDLTLAERRELAESLSTRHIELEFDLVDGEIEATAVTR